MIEFLKGIVAFKADDYVVVDVNNIGYKVYMTRKSIEQIEDDCHIKIFTYMRVLQDDISLFGFLSNEELAMFKLLITVGGIGAKSALTILSNITPTDFAIAVVSDDINKLKSLPGIGPKTAQRIVLELKDKVKHEQAIEESKNVEKKMKNTQNIQDAISALQVLGYNLKSIEKAFADIDVEAKTTEELIKIGLKELA